MEPNRLRDESKPNVTHASRQSAESKGGRRPVVAQTDLEDHNAPGLWYPGSWQGSGAPWLEHTPDGPPASGDSLAKSHELEPAKDGGPSYWVDEEPKAPRAVGANGRRDALIGGSILGVALAGLGIVSIVTAPDYGIESLRSPFGIVLLVLAVILGVSAVAGGRRARYSAGVVSVALGGLLITGYGLPLQASAAPFFVSAYLLLRSN